MITLFRLLAILCLFFNVSSYAVDCYQNAKNGPITITADIPSFRIPENAKPGQKIWESSDINVTVYCDNAPGWTKNNQTENIFA